jgi:outer membrane protein assembly factor BamB
MLFGDRLYLACMHSGPSYVLAIDKKTGKDVWKSARNLPCRGEATDSYSTPALLQDSGRDELIVAGAAHINAYDPATGKELWITKGLAIDHDWGRTISSPTAGEGIVVACSASTQGLGRAIAVNGGGAGDVTEDHRLWQYEKFTPDCPTPLIYQGNVYLLRDDGVGSCLDAKTGKLLWKKRIGPGDFKASPVAGDGKVYFLSVDGDCFVLEPGPEGNVIAQNHLSGRFIASPAIGGGRIYFRSKDRLYAVGKR